MESGIFQGRNPQTKSPRIASPTNYKRALGVGLFLGAALGLVWALSRRYNPETFQLIDWDRVRRIALNVCRLRMTEEISPTEKASHERIYSSLVDQVRPLVVQYTAAENISPVALVHVLDRAEWIDANIANYQLLFAPLEKIVRDSFLRRRSGPSIFTLTNRALASRYLGVLMGYLASSVLGQYDPSLLGRELLTPGRLYFLESNIRIWQRRLALPLEEFRTWVALHEVTHAWQFEAHPWLRDYLNAQLELYIQEIARAQAGFSLRNLLERLSRLENIIRGEGNLIELIITPKQREALRRLQALMCIIEGYGNHVMEKVASSLLPHYQLIRSRFQKRITAKSQAEKLFIKLTGLEVKLRQYIMGQAFVDQVVKKEGITFMNEVWVGPANLPTLQEIGHPELWIKRMKERVEG
ncbi:MAG: hypothetical protein DDT18_01254 [Actinobacteria bacterium]|nr:hypothetical protein [Actinomycetota bacterium]